MNESVRAITKSVLLDVAPEELLALNGYDPLQNNYMRAGHGPLGIGVETIAALLLPLIWKVVETLLEDITAEIRKETAKSFVKALRQIWGRVADNTEIPLELIAEVEERLRSEGVDLTKNPSLAASVAAALVKHSAEAAK
jgi:hypothetical protein